MRAALGMVKLAAPKVALDAATVKGFFPGTRYSSITANLPYVAAALAAFELTDTAMLCVALGTIRAEAAAFMPIAELPSHFNTLPGQPAFSAYEPTPGNSLAETLGNNAPGDGARFRGRGYVQLTGRDNYVKYGKRLDIPLAENPDSACSPEIAACLLAAYLDANQKKLRAALAKDDLKTARLVVNGGSHGLEPFCDTFTRARTAWGAAEPDSTKAVPVGAVPGSAPPISARRAALNVSPDSADLRDRSYTPPPHSLLKEFPPENKIIQFIGAYTQAGLILNQGKEGACTGFGLAGVVNHLRWRVNGMPKKLESASPRMLYHFAKLYDEFEGENYEGSSCRGALKGWFHNGVCLASQWPYAPGMNTLPLAGWDKDAVERTLGVYYRIDTRSITDLQAAIQEVGAIYVSAYTHAGWESTQNKPDAPASHADLPLISWNGRPSREGGHAFALVGFNRNGFVIQNSWGDTWGAGGFAVIGYADWLAHAMDAWVAALGVPGVVSGRLASGVGNAGGAALGCHPDWWDEDTAYRHSIVLGNNGQVSRFDQRDGVNRTLQHQACILPSAWFRQNANPVKRLVIYAHGGLNSEAAAIERAQAMGRYFLGNGCYPLFLVWKSGMLESLGNILQDKIHPKAAAKPGLAGGWFTDLTDPIVESTIGRPFARPLWSEMKENAELAAASGRGGDLLTEALRSLAGTWGNEFELHLVGHSAGSIILGRLLENLAHKGMDNYVKSVHLYAPACTVAFANRYYAPHANIMENLYLDILSDPREQGDNVAYLYQKSLLYFISNALEADLRTPILGLANSYDPGYLDWDGSPCTTEALVNWRDAFDKYNLSNRRTVHDKEKIIICRDGVNIKTDNASHGGFDNDIEVVGKTLERITTQPNLVMPVLDLTGF